MTLEQELSLRSQIKAALEADGPRTVQAFMAVLGEAGYAVAVFTPEEVGEADIEAVEEFMIQRGWEAIEDQNENEEDE